jgi:hypothetical protein
MRYTLMTEDKAVQLAHHLNTEEETLCEENEQWYYEPVLVGDSSYIKIYDEDSLVLGRL